MLEQLLRERVSIRDLGAILEALLETAPVNKSLAPLVEAARQALGRRLVRPLLDADGQLPVLLLDAALEEGDSGDAVAGERTAAPLTAWRSPGPPPVRRLPDSVRPLIGPPPPRPCPCFFVQVRRAITCAWLEPMLPASRWWRPVRFLRRFGCVRWERCGGRTGSEVAESRSSM